jgi:hypothetical protein
MLLIGVLVIVVGGLLTAFCLWTLRNPLAFVGFDKRSCGVEITDPRQFASFRRNQAFFGLVFSLGMLTVGILITITVLTIGDPDVPRQRDLELQRQRMQQMRQPTEFERKRADEAWMRFMNNPGLAGGPAAKPQNDPVPKRDGSQ